MTTSEHVLVVYCAENQQYRIAVNWHDQLTAQQALMQSGLAQKTCLPTPLELGVFSLKIDDPEQYVLQAGDRLEVYRPLKMNPKDVRRLRAQRNPVGRYRQGNQWKRQQKSTD